MKTIPFKNDLGQSVSRRKLFSVIAKGASIFGLASLAPAMNLQAKAWQGRQDVSDLEAWFDKLNGKHKMVFDVISANQGIHLVWSHTFLNTNNQTGTPDDDLGVMVVLRNKAIALAMEDRLWKKYKLGKFFSIPDLATNAPSERNPYWVPREGEMPETGMAIKTLMERGAMFCVCETALALNSKQVSKGRGMDPEAIQKDWIEGLLPGIRPVPSGVLALNRAQERGASYCYAG